MEVRRVGWFATTAAGAVIALSPVGFVACATQQHFASPDLGVESLVEAVKTNDQPTLKAILGPRADRLMSSGDTVADQHSREAFLTAYREIHEIRLAGDTHAVLILGQDHWPMPIPLVRSSDGWRFDTAQGEQEILVRRIGRNELAAIQTCLGIVEAAQEYATLDPDGDGIPEYAPQFVSTPGMHNGLYWPTKAGEPPSPLGPLLAAAASEGYTDATSKPLAPYHGYFYRILTKQGEAAPGGAYDYVIRGHMIGGFVVLAYPALYGVSGIMSFLVNQDGAIYEQNLGKNTLAIVSTVTAFNPDSHWRNVKVLAKDQ